MKKIFLISLLILTLCLSACAGATTPAATEAPAAAEAPAATEAPAAAEAPADAQTLAFSAEGLDGAAWDQSVFAESTVTMINFWEHWCPPCVEELPALQKLYETYADQGLMILGVFSDESDMDSVQARIDAAGLTYPILRYSPDFDALQTGYVPTTVFVNAQGEMLGEAVVGGHSYEDWAKLVESYL